MEEDLKLVLKKSVLNGGCILFAETDLMNRTIPYRFRLNIELERYGSLSDVNKEGMWYEFRINEVGRKFLEESIKPKKEKKDVDKLISRIDGISSILGKILSVVKSIFKLFCFMILIYILQLLL